ncbi:hypothetical protein TrVGV298_001687 [Trichoderma virens]|nr:hypothetical protein TrVGV298_001687 [Trichoderma virens]
MLYRRANKGKVINANDCEEVVKYINGTLKEEFDLNTYSAHYDSPYVDNEDDEQAHETDDASVFDDNDG